jgi:hypothetical protein
MSPARAFYLAYDVLKRTADGSLGCVRAADYTFLSAHHPELSRCRLELKCAFCNIFAHAKSCQKLRNARPVLSHSL